MIIYTYHFDFLLDDLCQWKCLTFRLARTMEGSNGEALSLVRYVGESYRNSCGYCKSRKRAGKAKLGEPCFLVSSICLQEDESPLIFHCVFQIDWWDVKF